MLKTVSMLMLLASTPALAQEGARTDLATIKKLVSQAASALTARGPGAAALSIAKPNLSDEIAQALRAPRENRLKVAPR